MIQNRNSNANTIIMQMNVFQESLSLFSEDRFFDIVRMYLGEIPTPFYKQRLIEQLTGFLLNQENQKSSSKHFVINRYYCWFSR